MPIHISEIKSSALDAYHAFISSRETSTFTDRYEWRKVIEATYPHRHFWYTASENERIVGTLALTLSKHPILGTYLSTAPFASYGGFHAENEAAARALLSEAARLCKEHRAKYALIRHLQPDSGSLSPPAEWQEDSGYAAYHLPLEGDADLFFRKHINKRLRGKVNSAVKHEFHFRVGQADLLPDFWYVISRSMKELGSPYHPYRYLKALLTELKDRAYIAILYDRENQPACCRLFVEHQGTAYSIHGNSLLKYRSLRAGDYFFWLFIRECYQRGLQHIDMGRSLVGSGNEVWKMKWRPHRRTLSYWYYLPDGSPPPQLNQKNPKYQLLIKTWQKLPLFSLKIIGPWLIRGIL